jgi:hypothetical protein
MASARRKSAAVALAVIGIAGLSLASAAQLGLTSASVGAGSTVVASCDTDGIAVGYTNAYNTTTNKYDVSGVTLTGVNAACNGLKYKIQLQQGTATKTALGGELTGASLTVAAGAASVPLSANVDAELVTGVSIVIYS